MPSFPYFTRLTNQRGRLILSWISFGGGGIFVFVMTIFLASLFPYPLSLTSWALVSMMVLWKHTNISYPIAWVFIMGASYDIVRYPAMPLLTMQLLCALVAVGAVGGRIHFTTTMTAAVGAASFFAWVTELLTRNGSGILNITMAATSCALTVIFSFLCTVLVSVLLHILRRLFPMRYASS
ncbi:MAG: hypothetical protein AB1352_04330 [Patescibacteria group bacterium]